MVITSFSMEDKEKKSHFFKGTFLLTNISIDVALQISFFTLSNVKIDFIGCHLYWKTYTFTKTFSIIRQVKLIIKKEFVAAALDPEDEALIVDVTSISQDLDVYPF